MKKVFILILLLVIGFAAVSTTLLFNGNIGLGLQADDFDVIFTSATLDGDISDNVIISENKKKVTVVSNKLTSIGDSLKLDYKIKNNSTQYGANVTLSCEISGSEYVEITSEFDGAPVAIETPVEMDAQETKAGYVNAELINMYTGADDSIAITCEILAKPTEKDNVVEPLKCDIENPPVKELNNWLWTDNDCSDDVSKDDLITVGSESFYVYNADGDTVKALSKYNLEVGNSDNSWHPAETETYIQSPKAKGFDTGTETFYGTVLFSNSDKRGEKDNSYNGSIVEDYVIKYVDILKTQYNVDVTGRLITKEELLALGCDSTELTCLAVPEYIYSTNYWTSTPDEMSDASAFGVNRDGSISSGFVNFDSGFGVRPVIEIPKSAFQ